MKHFRMLLLLMAAPVLLCAWGDARAAGGAVNARSLLKRSAAVEICLKTFSLRESYIEHLPFGATISEYYRGPVNWATHSEHLYFHSTSTGKVSGRTLTQRTTAQIIEMGRRSWLKDQKTHQRVVSDMLCKSEVAG